MHKGAKGWKSKRGRGAREGGGRGRPRFKQMGAWREGGCWGGPAPESWDLPPTLPRNGLAHSLGRAGQAGRPRGAGAWARGEPALGGPDSPVGARRAVVEGSEGAGPERCPQGQAACHFLICWADFLSPEGEGAGRVGGAR